MTKNQDLIKSKQDSIFPSTVQFQLVKVLKDDLVLESISYIQMQCFYESQMPWTNVLYISTQKYQIIEVEC